MSVKDDLSVGKISLPTAIAIGTFVLAVGGALIKVVQTINELQTQLAYNTERFNQLVEDVEAMVSQQGASMPAFAVLQRRVEVLEAVDAAQNNRLDDHNDDIGQLRRATDVMGLEHERLLGRETRRSGPPIE